MIGQPRFTIAEWFRDQGAYVLVDGQYGSTGKGLFAHHIMEQSVYMPNWITTNAGPNSGHTTYDGGVKIVSKQIPISTIISHRRGNPVRTLLNAGAVISPGILLDELNTLTPGAKVPFIHPCAAVITARHIERDASTLRAIAGTGKGIGPAIQDKIGRVDGSIASDLYFPVLPVNEGRTWDNFWDWRQDRVFVETAQGFSLGLNSSFYPNVTSRECTVMQALADARIPVQKLKKVAMTVRTFPIRVGNTENTSGEWYDDQQEIEWGDLQVEPERTTVTNRIRRVATWSRDQFRDGVAANRPQVLFLNFLNYLTREEAPKFIENLFSDYMMIMGHTPECYYGFGPRVEDIYDVWYKGEGRFRGQGV